MTLRAKFALEAGTFSLSAQLQIEDGVLVLFGPSGAGKSLTLAALAGFVVPSSGSISIEGRTLFDSAAGINIPTRHRGIGYVPQHHSLFPFLTVAENVSFGLPRRDRRRNHPKVRRLLDELELSHLSEAHPSSLSGGERQRAAFARALAVEPKLLLLDEPFASLDQDSKVRMRSVLAELVDQHQTPAILITHDRSEALSLGNQLVLFERGKTVATGTPRDLLAASTQRVPADLWPNLLIQGTVSGADSAKDSGVLRLSNVEIRGPIENLRPDAEGRVQITASLPKDSK